MSIDHQKITEIASAAKQTEMGGRKEIEAQQLNNLRRLVEKVRRESPLFRKSNQPPKLGDSGKFQEVVPIKR
jgi:phenylacetate-coenzyme A ligase PaaK-like adenylate-forming protein